MQKLKHFIGGKYVEDNNTDCFNLVSPVTGEVYATSPNGGEVEVSLAYRAAEQAFAQWRNSTPGERQKRCSNLPI